MPNENNFPAWLRAALNGRPNAYLVKNSGEKDNGRPVIDDSRVSKWLKGDQRPSLELASLAARVLGGSEAEALQAAGHTYGFSLGRIEEINREFPTPRNGFEITTDQLDRLDAAALEIQAVVIEIKKGGRGDGETPAKKKPDGGASPAGLSIVPSPELSEPDDNLSEVAHPTNTGQDLPPGESQGDDNA